MASAAARQADRLTEMYLTRRDWLRRFARGAHAEDSAEHAAFVRAWAAWAAHAEPDQLAAERDATAHALCEARERAGCETEPQP